MRVIAGKARRLLLKTPEGLDTRPTTDRIKETLFNMLQDYVPGAVFVDLFSGSGGIGIEALSRGARHAYFADNGRAAQNCIKENLHTTHLEDEATLLSMEASQAVQRLEQEKVRADIIFMDPPYQHEWEKRILTQLSGSPVVTDETLIIVEAARGTDFSYLENLGFEAVKIKEYKTNEHIWIQRWKR